jgi:hypothetical protein
MNQLYPIIRRKRRPLIQENSEILKAETLKPEPAPVTPAPKQPKTTDAKPTPQDESY